MSINIGMNSRIESYGSAIDSLMNGNGEVMYDYSSPVDDFDDEKSFVEENESHEIRNIVQNHSYNSRILARELPKYSPPKNRGKEKREKKKPSPKRKIPLIKLYPTKRRKVTPPGNKTLRERGRELKHQAQEIMKSQPRKGCVKYLEAGKNFLLDANKYVLKGYENKALQYYETNISYFNQIGKLFFQRDLEFGYGLSMLCSAFCSLQKYVLKSESIREQRDFIERNFKQRAPVNDVLRKETCQYIKNTSCLIDTFSRIVDSKKYIPEKFLPSPLHKNFFFTEATQFVEYLERSLENM